jgi:hypothetical protein
LWRGRVVEEEGRKEREKKRKEGEREEEEGRAEGKIKSKWRGEEGRG